MYRHHLNASSLEAARAFWVDALGAAPMTATPLQFRIEHAIILVSPQPPTGGSKGTTVDHIGFQVPDLQGMVDQLTRAGYPIVTRAELPAVYEVRDDLGFVADQNAYVAFVIAPDGNKVELIEHRAMTTPIAFHHLHFAAHDVDSVRAWYVAAFGATPGRRGSLETADLPGVNLTFSRTAAAVVGTRGRAIDRIGLEVSSLTAFSARLVSCGLAAVPLSTTRSAMGTSSAILSDPWGTCIEVTEAID